MSDKPALPAGWTGTAPDADAMFAMAEVALDTMPAVFLPHIQGVVIAIEEFADDEVLKSLDIEHPYDLTGLYEGRPLTERSIDKLRRQIKGHRSQSLNDIYTEQCIHSTSCPSNAFEVSPIAGCELNSTNSNNLCIAVDDTYARCFAGFRILNNRMHNRIGYQC